MIGTWRISIALLALVLGQGFSLNLDNFEPRTRRQLVRGIFDVVGTAAIVNQVSPAFASGAGPEEAAR
jgi:hypothetical protein